MPKTKHDVPKEKIIDIARKKVGDTARPKGSAMKLEGDPKKDRTEQKRKDEEILTYSASGDVKANRTRAQEKADRIKNMSQEEYDKMMDNIDASAARSAEKRANREKEKEANRAEIARRNAMSKSERRKEDRRNKRNK